VTLVHRVRLLKKQGIKTKVAPEERIMGRKPYLMADPNRIPSELDLPSTWPKQWRGRAIRLGSAVILTWRTEVLAEGRRFVIAYIPREGEMNKPNSRQDSWKSWLDSLCREHDIEFIDPTSKLLQVQLTGKEVFYDHFTVAGHAAFAAAFVEWFEKNESDIMSYEF
ncbi:MAG: hypothetical protein ACXAB4_01340, partial [Candidatus Hodarchaeales archaeon]